jgi:hypothetical protein
LLSTGLACGIRLIGLSLGTLNSIGSLILKKQITVFIVLSYLLVCFPVAVSGSTLFPVAPVLTRYTESINPFAKRKFIEPTVPEEKVATKLNNLTVPKLCVKLNTLQVSFWHFSLTFQMVL